MRMRSALPTLPTTWPLGTVADELAPLFGAFLGSDATRIPPLNVEQDDEGLRIQALLPGWSPEEIELTLEHGHLTLQGEPKADGLPGRMAFRRQLRLPFRPSHDGLEASLQLGVLTLRLARPAEERPASIPIRTASND